MAAQARLPVRGQLADLWRSAPTWGTAALATAAVVWSLAGTWRVMPFVELTAWLLVGLVGVPLAFVLGLGAVAAVLSVLLTALSLPWLLRGPPTGLGTVLVEVWRLAAAVLPGYATALRRVRRPWLWGCVLGHCVGTGAFVLRHGFGPAPV